MLAGQAHEIETRWRQAAPESKARDARHARAAMAARTEHPGPRTGWPHPRVRERLTTSLRTLADGVKVSPFAAGGSRAKRLIGLLAVVALASLAMIPAATPVAATTVCGDLHFFTATVTFPAGYWTVGQHTLTWEAAGVFSDTNGFEVDAAAPIYPGAVLLTNYGTEVQLLAIDGTEPTAINPAQRTVARDIAISDDVPFLVFVHNHFTETLSWDGSGSSSMQFGGLSSVCLYGGPYQLAVGAEWLRAYPLFLRG